jgi:hypothetical protein
MHPVNNQQAKSHQLPYSVSNHESKFPLKLAYSDVWGPTSTSTGGYRYYVSFIDDYSKFNWIYLLKFKSQVFQLFHDFQKIVERFFSRKIITMQTDWGWNTRNAMPFSRKLASPIMCHALIPSTKWVG